MQGSCLCGTVQFDIAGKLPGFYQCHCSLCRKQGGSQSNTATLVREETFRWTAGEDNVSNYRKPTGFRANFCATCGSPVPNPLGDSVYVWVPAGLLDEAVSLQIVAQLHIGSKAPWDAVHGPGTRHETMPTLQRLIHILHSAAIP